MKKNILSVLFSALTLCLWSQENPEKISNDTINRIESQSIEILDEDSQEIPTFEHHNGSLNLRDITKAETYDKSWLQELSDRNLYKQMYEDIQTSYQENADYEEELTTELLKERLEELNQKTLFHIEYNPILERVIKAFLKNRRTSLQRLMNISQYYFPMFEQELLKKNIPLEIKYLPIVESALNPRAVSPVGAKGLWQFMYYTGRMYGLEVSNYVDERNDPIRSTKAAAEFLNRLYDMFKDWDLVLAAYNSGPGNVTKAMRRSGGKTNYWNLRPYLPRETAGYVPAFLATMYIFEYAQEHGFKTEKRDNIFFETDTIQVKRSIPFKDIAQMIGIQEQELEFLNPSYTLNIVPFVKDKNYGLRIPIELVGKFVSNEELIYAYIDQELSQREKPLPELVKGEQFSGRKKTYIVRSGDTLGGIALRYKVSVKNLKKWNNIKGTNIRIGQKIMIY